MRVQQEMRTEVLESQKVGGDLLDASIAAMGALRVILHGFTMFWMVFYVVLRGLTGFHAVFSLSRHRGR